MKRFDQINSVDGLQQALWGKSHYFDDNSRRFHRSRPGQPLQVMLRESIDAPGAFADRYVYIAESCGAGWTKEDGRAYKAMRVDLLTGRVVNLDAQGKPSVMGLGDEGMPTSIAQANKRVFLAYQARQKAITVGGSWTAKRTKENLAAYKAQQAAKKVSA